MARRGREEEPGALQVIKCSLAPLKTRGGGETVCVWELMKYEQLELGLWEANWGPNELIF